MTEPHNQAVSDSTDPENEADGKSTSEVQAVANVVPTTPGPGLLDLPPEVRTMIYRHLLVHPSPQGGALAFWPGGLRPDIGIMRTNRLIHREAFNVLYRENTFGGEFFNPLGSSTLSQFPRLIDAMQNLELLIRPSERSSGMRKFTSLIRHFGNPCIIRNTLAVHFDMFDANYESTSLDSLDWFLLALTFFTHFRTVELVFNDLVPSESTRISRNQHVAFKLEPMLGSAESFDDQGTGLRFRPLDHENLQREPDNVDWADIVAKISLE